MKISIHQKPLIFSFIILASLGAVGYAVYKSIQKLLDSAALVEHTEQVIYKTGNILSIVKDVETASRGFVITRDSSYLVPLYSAEKTVFTAIGELRQLVQDNPLLQERIDSLNYFVRKRIDFSYQTIDLINSRGLESAVAHIATRQGKLYTDSVREITSEIQTKQGGLLKQQRVINERTVNAFNRFTLFIFILMIGLTILLLFAATNYLFQNNEKEKRRAELIIANKELAFQNGEKEKRAAELIVANKELAFQNKEKESRAAELIIANKELLFQNKEKEKRAAELIIANAELLFQNAEKEKRAAELIIVNKELKTAEDDIRKLNEELEQKVIERTAQLETSNKELESFSYSVSHDLRAPIRSISGHALILEEDYAAQLDAEGTKTIHSIMSNAKKMGNLIDDLLAFSKLGRKEVDVSVMNMNSMVKSVIEELHSEDIENRTEINETSLPKAKGDPSLIRQVWINLLSNAIKYSKYKSKSIIETGAYTKDNMVVYYVRDNGAGFDMKYYDKLFGVFQRLHSQDAFEGTGIGLAIVQKIVQRHNGTVWAESRPEEGAVFYFSLPAISA
jgi:signal transduction histidine kinase